MTLPVQITGTTAGAIDFQYYTFTLAEVTRLHLEASVPDFADAAEKTAIGIDVLPTMPSQDVNGSMASLHLDPSTPADSDDSRWLYPGDYQIAFRRSTSASANTNTPTLPHGFALSITTERPPTESASCTLPPSAVSDVDVRARAACNAWCAKLPACGVACRNDCDIPVGQCAESVLAKLACNNKATLECTTQGSGRGYSMNAICNLDASLCPAGSVRTK